MRCGHDLTRIREISCPNKRGESARAGKAALRAELAEVVIGVKIGQAIPFALRHLAKVGMGLPVKVARLACKALGESTQLPHVSGKLDRWRAASLLVQFRSSFESMRPLEERPEREPFYERARSRD